MNYRHKAIAAVTGIFLFINAGSLYASSALPASLVLPPGIWKNIRVSMIVHLSAKDFSRFSGHKLNPVQRVAFSVMKRKMKKELKRNPELTAGEFYARIRVLEKIWLLTLVGLTLLLLLVILLLARL